MFLFSCSQNCLQFCTHMNRTHLWPHMWLKIPRLRRPHKKKTITISRMLAHERSTSLTPSIPSSRTSCRSINTALLRQKSSLALWPKLPLPYPTRRECGQCPDAARPHHQRAEKAWQQCGQALFSAAYVAPSETHSWNTEKLAAPPKPREDTAHAFTLWFAAKNLQTRALLRNPGGSQLCNPGRLIFSLPLLSHDAVRPWMCECGLI